MFDDATLTLSDAEELQNIEEYFEYFKKSSAVSGGLLLIGSTARIAVPLLAITGWGIPAAVALLALSEGINIMSRSVEVKYVMTNSKHLLEQFVTLYESNLTTVSIYLKELLKLPDVDISHWIIQETGIDNSFLIKVSESLDAINVILTNLIPKKKGTYFQKLLRLYNRSFSPSFYLNQLKREMLLLNGHMTIFEAKFQRIINVYNYFYETQIAKLKNQISSEQNNNGSKSDERLENNDISNIDKEKLLKDYEESWKFIKDQTLLFNTSNNEQEKLLNFIKQKPPIDLEALKKLGSKKTIYYNEELSEKSASIFQRFQLFGKNMKKKMFSKVYNGRESTGGRKKNSQVCSTGKRSKRKYIKRKQQLSKKKKG